MSNANKKLSTASRAMIAGAMVGGGASVISRWNTYKAGDVDTHELARGAVKAALQAGAVSGVTTYAAEKMAGRPVLSMLTLVAAGTAGLYLMDQLLDSKKHDRS
ncbi:hypothetical protein [Endozoicomonas sp. GU-1]|uniref:hypothetical protein n=1 Tax=unclassified Endozoicomonas TaxID=2644528 RepID=UPI0022B36569|nr:hypothetical protein [Endozoicomonas sp. GU-1]WBA81900.1 hypothetical protein O2T12_01630 [Endozoicomonas sp. GU-1]WBA84854.1 hypothetical protein O3276_16430 [Endozoicomonas sp. GU-1]